MNKKVVSPSLLVAMALLLVFAAAGAVQIMSLNSGFSLIPPLNLNAPAVGSSPVEIVVNEEAILSASRVDGKLADSSRNHGPTKASDLRGRDYASEQVAAVVPHVRPSYSPGTELATDERYVALPEPSRLTEADQAKAIELSEPLTDHNYAALLERSADGDFSELRARNYGPETAVIVNEAPVDGGFAEIRARNYGPETAVVVNEAPVDGGFAEIRDRNYGPEPVITVAGAASDGGFAEIRARNYGPEPVLSTGNPFAELRDREDYIPGGPAGH